MIKLYFDGACNNLGNPPLMGVGVAVFLNGEAAPDYEVAMCPGVGTNNIAEWEALCSALEVARKLNRLYPDDPIRIYGDSQLIVRQFNGDYDVKKPEFRKYFNKARTLRGTLNGKLRSVSWVPRENNTRADMLSKKGLIPEPRIKK